MAPKKERVLHKRLSDAPRENFHNTFPRLKVSPTMPPPTIPEDSSGNSGSHTSTTAYPHGEVQHLSWDQYCRSVSSFSPSTVMTQYHQHFYHDVPNPNYDHSTLTERQPTSFPHDYYGENSPSYTLPHYAAPGVASTAPRPSCDIMNNPLASGVCLAGHLLEANMVTGQCSSCSSAPTSHGCYTTGPLTTGDGSGRSGHFSEAALYLPSPTQPIHVSESQEVFTRNYEHPPLQHLPPAINGSALGQYEDLEGYAPGYYGWGVIQRPQTQDYDPDSEDEEMKTANNNYGQAMDSSRYDWHIHPGYPGS